MTSWLPRGTRAGRRLCGPRFELPNQIEHLARFVAAIDGVARVHERGVSADPAVARIDELGLAKNRRVSVERAVHVADRHDTARGRQVAGLVWGCPAAAAVR
jgi:hypothetical protein